MDNDLESKNRCIREFKKVLLSGVKRRKSESPTNKNDIQTEKEESEEEKDEDDRWGSLQNQD